MSLMIRGMKLPISCSSCWFSQTEYKGLNEYCKAMKNEEVTKYTNQNKGRHPQCPLVEIPENHGRLIDADAYQYSGDLIDEPTIIEAEASE